MKQTLFKSEAFLNVPEEILTLQGMRIPLSVEETIHYLRAVVKELEAIIN